MENKSVTFSVDGSSNLIQLTDRKGQITHKTYDALNRISRIAYADGRTADTTYDLLGNLIRVSDSVSGECLYAYDDLNRIVSETTNRGIVSYAYDALNRLIERRINGTDPTQYKYDKANRIKTITYRNSTVSYIYDGAGRLVSRTLPNDITQTFAYNAANELLSITYKKTDGTVVERVSYTYDEGGNRTTRNRAGLGSVPETPFTATYDANNRMLTYASVGSTTAQPLAYDDNGNLIQRQSPQGTIAYTWDTQNRLSGISGPNGTASFKYDYRGRRIEKTINGNTTSYLYDGPQAIAELQGSSIGATYLTGLQIDEVLARYTNQGNRTLLTDALGSILAQSDDSQTNTTLYGYSPFGESTQIGENNSNSLQYAGRENDNTGLSYYRARYYDPQLKRFISSDPVGLAGGINWYAYVANDPLDWRDPWGLDRLINPHPAGPGGPTITFQNDIPGGPSTNQPVSDATADMIENAVRESGMDININSTIGGSHGANSRHSTGQAVDINGICGKPVGPNNPFVPDFQDTLNDQPNIRENFGPSSNTKTQNGNVSQRPDQAAAHGTHVHASGQQ